MDISLKLKDCLDDVNRRIEIAVTELGDQLTEKEFLLDHYKNHTEYLEKQIEQLQAQIKELQK